LDFSRGGLNNGLNKMSISGGTAPQRKLLSRKAATMSLSFLLALSTYAVAATGAETYKAHCSPCHGAKGNGDTMLGRNLDLRPLGSDEVQNKSDEELFAIIRKGRNRMPAFDRRLSKDQTADVVKYIRSLKK
jgi:mono/diheme cytochrome c family protein